MHRRFHRNHLLPIFMLALFLLLSTSHSTKANDVVLQLNNQGLTLLNQNKFRLGPVTLFLSPWLYTILELNETNYGLQEAGVDLGFGNLHLLIGRQINSFGPGRYAFPLLAPLGDGLTTEGLDQIAYSFSTKRLDYNKFYAWVPLNDENRLLLGQRATYDFGPFTFGFAEIALAKETIPNFYYLPLPLVPIAAYRLLDDHFFGPREVEKVLKILTEIDLTLRLGSNFKIYGSYLIDGRPLFSRPDGSALTKIDYQRADRKPWNIGYQGGSEWNRPLGIKGLKFYTEYTRINQYTYALEDPILNYTYKGKFLGGPLGPDSDLLNLELSTTGDETWTFAFAYSRKRQGEGLLDEMAIDHFSPSEAFLTGTVETTDQFALTVIKRMGYTDQVALTLSLARISNEGHIPGGVNLRPEISLVSKVSW